MAYGKKTGGKDFIPGQPGGPGRPHLPQEIREGRKLNQIRVSEVLNKFIDMPLEDVIRFVQDKTNPAMEVLVGSILVHGIKHGDQNRLNFLLDRLIGRVKEQHEHTFAGNLNSVIVDMVEEIEKSNLSQGVNDGEENSSQEKIGKKEQEVIK